MNTSHTPSTATSTAALSAGLAADRPMDAQAASDYLASLGFPLATATLARLRCVGGGAKFLKHGHRIFYRPAALREWVEARTQELAHTPPRKAA